MKNFIQWIISLFSKKVREIRNKGLIDVNKAKDETIKRIENADTDFDKKLSINEMINALKQLKKDLISKAMTELSQQKK